MDLKKSKEKTPRCVKGAPFLLQGTAREKEERYFLQKLNVLTTRDQKLTNVISFPYANHSCVCHSSGRCIGHSSSEKPQPDEQMVHILLKPLSISQGFCLVTPGSRYYFGSQTC